MQVTRRICCLMENYWQAAVLFCLFTVLPTRLLRAEDIPQLISAGSNAETIVDRGPKYEDSASLDPEPFDSGLNYDYSYSEPQSAPYFLRFRGGASYLDSSQTDFGGAYGLDFILPVSNAVGGYASISANHFSGSTQMVWTAGVIKGLDPVPGLFSTIPPPMTPSQVFASRFSYSVLFDNLILFDVPSGGQDTNLFLGQIRSTISFRLSRDAAVGLIYTKPIRGDSIAFATALGPVTSPLEFSEGIGPFFSAWVGEMMLTGSATYRDGRNVMLYSGSVRRPLSERITAFANANYQEEGNWASFAGIEIALGPKSRRCGYRSSSGCCANSVPRGRYANGDVVRGQLTPEERRRQQAANRFMFDGLCGATATKYRNRRGESEPFNDPAHSETLNSNNDPATLFNSVRGMSMFMQVMQGNGNGNGVCPPGEIESPPGSGNCFPEPN